MSYLTTFHNNFCYYVLFLPLTQNHSQLLSLSRYMSVHVFTGLLVFIMACATALMGLLEKAIWKLGGEYNKKYGEDTFRLINFDDL